MKKPGTTACAAWGGTYGFYSIHGLEAKISVFGRGESSQLCMTYQGLCTYQEKWLFLSSPGFPLIHWPSLTFELSDSTLHKTYRQKRLSCTRKSTPSPLPRLDNPTFPLVLTQHQPNGDWMSGWMQTIFTGTGKDIQRKLLGRDMFVHRIEACFPNFLAT